MLQLEEAIDTLLCHIHPITDRECIPILHSSGRILCRDYAASFDQPPFPRSPLDGYAVRGCDTLGAGRKSPKQLAVTGRVYAGERFFGEVKEGEAVRIATGAPIPRGADTVIRQENTDYGKDNVLIYRESPAYENYCFQGEDYREGEILLGCGTRMDGVSIALAASMGISELEVWRQPKIAVISTGDELIQPGMPMQDGKIYDANRHLISGRLLDFGIAPFASIHWKDEAEGMAEKIRELSREADVIVTTGGVSVGERDRMHQVMTMLSAKSLFWRVEIKPGAPTLAAVFGRTLIICLSGNPFAAAANFELLVRPVIKKLTGDKRWEMKRLKAAMENDYRKMGGVRRFLRGYMENGKVWASAGNHASGSLSSMVGCNCLIEISPEQNGAVKGDEVWVNLL